METIEDNTMFGLRADIFRIIVSQLLCLPLGVFYNFFLVNKSAQTKHLFNIVTGLLVCYYNFGVDTIHSVATCLLVWCSIKALGPGRLMVGLNFVFIMTYLLAGYYQKEWLSSDQFTWTLPQCVLSLALIAVSYDVYDGENNRRKAKKNDAGSASVRLINLNTALDSTPSLLELFGKIYFVPSFLIGPQITFREYLAFSEQTSSTFSACWPHSLIRLGVSLLYFSFQTLGQTYFPQQYFLSSEFFAHGFLYQLGLLALGNKLMLCKYISAWALSESGCIMYGISYNPATEKVDRCYNMNITQYETATTFGSLIQSFNMSTNAFALRYVYKRLAWARSRLFSQVCTVAFLAVWHGFLFGYYNTFALEIVMMIAERDWTILVSKLGNRSRLFVSALENPFVQIIVYLFMRLHIVVMFGYAFTSFGFLEFSEWNLILSNLYYCGHWIYFGWVPLSFLLQLN